MKKIIISISIILYAITSFAQIQGYVLDKNTNQPLPGCMVKIREINKAVLTDENGFFSFNSIPEGKFTLEFSYLGYDNAYKQVTYNHKTINIKLYLQPSPIKTDEVIVTGWVPTSQHTSAMKVDEINLNLTNQILPNVLHSLTTVPGVDIISKGLGIGTPVIRGLSRTNIVVLNNGFRLENYQFSENHPFFIDNVGTKKIEVIKGPSSLLYGSDAIGGVINILWEDPASINHVNADYSAQYNTNTRGIETNAGIKSSTEKMAWGVRVGYNINGDMQDGLGEQIKNTRFLMQDVKSFLILNNEESSHKFYYQYDRNKLGLCVKPALPLVNDNKMLPEAFYQDLSHIFIGNKNTFFFNKSLNLHANFSYEFNRRAIRIKKTQPAPIDMKLHNLNYDIYLTAENNRLTFVTGSQGWFVQNTNYGKSVFLPNYQSLNTSAFGLLHYIVSRRIHIITGLRYDFSAINLQPINDTTTSIISKTYNNLSGSIGGTFHISQHALLRFNSATAYRNPNSAELGELGIHAYRYELGNPGLRPQHSFENDLSLHIHSQKLIADLAVFHNVIKNYIFLAPTPDTASNGMEIYTYEQSNALLYGLETGIQAEITPNLTTKIIYSYIKTKDSLGRPLPLIPQNKLKAFLNLNIKHIGLFTNVTMQLNPVYAFAYPHPAPNEMPSNAYFLLNMSISSTLSIGKANHITMFINGYNLTNTVYSDHLSTLRQAGFYDMGRNISFGLRWNLDYTRK